MKGTHELVRPLRQQGSIMVQSGAHANILHPFYYLMRYSIMPKS